MKKWVFWRGKKNSSDRYTYKEEEKRDGLQTIVGFKSCLLPQDLYVS